MTQENAAEEVVKSELLTKVARVCMLRINRYITIAIMLTTALLAAITFAASKFLFTIWVKPATGTGDIINVVNLSNSWVTFSGHTLEAKIPKLELVYRGPKRMTYLRDTNNVTIIVPENFTILYGIGHVNFTLVNTRIIVRWRSPQPLTSNTVNLTCIHATIKTLRNAISQIINQATDTLLRQLIRQAPIKSTEYQLSALEAGVPLTISQPGLYICAVYLNKTITVNGKVYNNVTVLGLGLVYAVSYRAEVSAPASLLLSKKYLHVTVTVRGTLGKEYRYVVFVLHRDVFSRLVLSIITNGKIPGTKIYLTGRGGTKLIVWGQTAPRELKILGKGLEKTKVEDFRDVLLAIFGSNAAAIGYSNPTTQSTYERDLDVSKLRPDTYILYGLLVDPSTKEIVAINLTKVILQIPAKVHAVPAPKPVIKPKPVVRAGTATYTVSKYMVSVPGVFTGTLVTLEMSSADKVLTLKIPAFTITLYKGHPVALSEISLKAVERSKAPTSNNVEIVGKNVYVIETKPSGITFYTPVEVKLKLPGSGNYYIAIWNSTLKMWVPLPTEVKDGYAVAHVRVPGMIALVKLRTPTKPTVGKLELEAPSLVTAGIPFTVKVRVLSPEGTPVANAIVRLYIGSRYVAYAMTNANGIATFRLTVRTIGVFTLKVECDGKTTSSTIVISPVIE